LREEFEDVTLASLGGQVVREHRACVAVELFQLALALLRLTLLAFQLPFRLALLRRLARLA
jgi:hypothetical protein